MKKIIAVALPMLFLSGCAVGYNKETPVTILGTHQMYSVKKGSTLLFKDGTKRDIVEDSTLMSDFAYAKILKAKTKYESNEKDEATKEKAGAIQPVV